MPANAFSGINTFLRSHYPDSAELRISPLIGGEENQNFRVRMGRSECVLRVYSLTHSTTGPRQKQDIQFELDLIEHLVACGVPTPKVIRTRDGEKVITVEIAGQSHYAVLFEFAPGEEAAEYNSLAAGEMARLLASLRIASLSFQYPSVRAWPGDIISLSLNEYRGNREVISEKFRSVLDGLYEKSLLGYAQIQQEGLPRGIVHGDIKLGNVLFVDGRISAVIDFDDYRESYLLEDFTRTVMHDLDSPTRNVIRSGNFPLLLNEYSAHPSVTAAEIADLKTFLQARFLYDVAVYLRGGHLALVEALFADPALQEHLVL